MWKFGHSNVFMLFLWTIYGPLLNDYTSSSASLGVLGQQTHFGHSGFLGQLQQQQQQQPCDRTRRVFTDTYGEISDGPAGSNYTQVRVWFHTRRVLLKIVDVIVVLVFSASSKKLKCSCARLTFLLVCCVLDLKFCTRTHCGG